MVFAEGYIAEAIKSDTKLEEQTDDTLSTGNSTTSKDQPCGFDA
jgi:hypothetical protein